MAAVAKNPAFAKKVGIKPSVGEEFLKADKGKTFKKGGMMKKTRKYVEGGLEDAAYEGLAEAGRYGGIGRGEKMPNDNASYADASAKMKRMGVKPNSADYRLGMKTLTRGTANKELNSLLPKMPKSYDAESGMKKGGMAKSDMKEDMKMDKKQDVSMIKKAFKQHDMQEHKGGKGTKLKLAKGGSFRSSADGCATKGKTKGTMIKMCGGGKM